MIQPRGFIGVVTVMTVSVITLALAVTSAYLSIDELIIASASDQSQRALHLADGCAEEGLYRVKLSSAYVGGTILFTGGSCTLVVSGSGSTRTVTSTVVLGSYTRVVQSQITLSQNVATNADGIDVTAWSEQ